MSIGVGTPIPAGMVALAGGIPTVLGPDGRPVSSGQYQSLIDPGPGAPLSPRITLPHYAPREYQYTPNWNMFPTPRTEAGGYSFAQLRAWAKACPELMTAIKYRQNQLRGCRWAIVPAEDEKSPTLKAELADEITAARLFWERPNRVDKMDFSSWIAQAVHEMFTTDALCFHKQRTNGGDLHSVTQIDGATIKPIIDNWGHVVGYQQILWGYPATGYNSTPTVDSFDADEMLYWVYNPRVDNVYGTAPIEDILPLILTAIKRSQTHVAWYTEGTIPDAFLGSPEGWGPDQIAQYQAWWDAELSDTRSKRKLRLIPNGSEYIQARPFDFSKDEHEAIVSMVWAYMAVPKHIIVSQVNRATSESQGEEAADYGFSPLIRFLDTKLSEITAEIASEKVVFRFQPVQSADQLKDAQTRAVYINAGVIDADEARTEMGLPPREDEQGEKKQVGIDPALIQRAFLEAGVITRDELRATIGLGPAKEGGGQYITIGAFGATAPDAMDAAAEAPKTPPALAPFAGKNPPPGKETEDGEPAQKPGAAVAGGGDSAEADDAAGDGAGDDTEAAKSERAAWRRFALARFAKGRHADAFTASAIGSDDHAAIASALAAARTREEVLASFEKAAKKKLTGALKMKAVGEIKSAARKWFEAEYKVARAKGAEMLAGNVDA
ncbi:MAG: phage portal protein [Myxococcales bacterium]|nr:phage portal protein [Myxococcales bacterium]